MIADKIKNARTIKKLTQEHVAEDLNVSRQTISNWENGRGYPSIDSLKTISGFFSILIDELLSADALVSIAEKENRSNIQRICDVLFGTVDLIGILLALLPLYSRQMDNSVIAVNLWEFKPANGWICIICWLLIVAFVLLGIAKMVLNHMCIDNGKNAITISSLLISMTAVLYAVHDHHHSRHHKCHNTVGKQLRLCQIAVGLIKPLFFPFFPSKCTNDI